MANIILVAGTFHGGWYWQPIIGALTNAGHTVFTPTLSGLDPEKPVSGPINLDTHIDDVLRLIETNNLAEVVLVGWSYAGMVITGVAARTSAKVQKLLYLDAQLPKPGEREWDLIPEADRKAMLADCTDGICIYPALGMLQHEPRMRPHPIAAKLQPLNYDQSRFDQLDKVFVFAEKWFHNPSVSSPIEVSYLRAKGAPGWVAEVWPFGHDLVREAPEQVAALINREAAGQKS